MGAQVYIDLYFLINMSMDFFCLLITLRLLHRRSSLLRLLIGALLGGGYAVAALLLGFSGAIGFLLDCAAAVLICATVLCTRGARVGRILQASLVFVLISMTLGGIMTALYTALNRMELPFEALQGDSISVWLFALLALVSGLATARGGRLLGISQKTKQVTVEAVILGKPVVLRAMVDSGNLLCDPISGRSVIVADRARLQGVLPSFLLEMSYATDSAVLSRLEQDVRLAHRVRLIPTKTATGEGILVAILPDSLTVVEGRERRRGDYLVAVSSLGESANGFDAVIAPF